MRDRLPYEVPLRPWHDVVVALAVGLQVFALSQCLSRLSPRFAWVFSLAVALAALPALRTRSVFSALPLRWLATTTALLLAGVAIGALMTPERPWDHLRRNVIVLTAMGCWLWTLHAPLSMSRWWMRAVNAPDAGIELAESLGASLAAVGLALLVRACSAGVLYTSPTLWGASLSAALGVIALAASLVAHWRRRLWMRRVIADKDPVWRLADVSDAAGVAPWTHAETEHVGAKTVVRRAREGHYRSAENEAPHARLGGSGAAPFWIRQGLHALSFAWVFALVTFGAPWSTPGAQAVQRAALVDPVAEATARLRALRSLPSPCALREGARRSETRLFAFSSPERLAEDHTDVRVWSSGAVMLFQVGGHGGPGSRTERCVSAALAARWIAEPANDDATVDQAVGVFYNAPEDTGDAPLTHVCAPGHWCSLMFQTSDRSGPGTGILNANGRWTFSSPTLQRTGRIADYEARALFDVLQGVERRAPPDETPGPDVPVFEANGPGVSATIAFPTVDVYGPLFSLMSGYGPEGSR